MMVVRQWLLGGIKIRSMHFRAKLKTDAVLSWCELGSSSSENAADGHDSHTKVSLEAIRCFLSRLDH